MKNRFDIFLLLIFIIYIYMRLFVGFEYYWIHGDEARWLCVAKNFPNLFNHSIYVDHALFFPFLVRLFSLFFADLTAAMVVNSLSSLIIFISLIGIAKELNLDRHIRLLILLFAAMNMPLIYLTKIPFREELYVGLFSLNIYLFLRAFRTKRLLDFLLAGMTGGLVFMTADITTVLLLPAYVLGWISLTKKGTVGWRLGLIPLILMCALFFVFVILPRYKVFSTHTYYPAAKGGRIERVDNFNLIQLTQPIYFRRSHDLYKHITKVQLDYKRIRSVFLTLVSYSNWDGITQRKIGFLEYAILIIILIGFFLNNHNRAYIFLRSLFICASIPILNIQTHPGNVRFVILAVIPAAIFWGIGFGGLFDRLKIGILKDTMIKGGICLIALSIIYCNIKNPIKRYSIFRLKKDVETQRLAEYINRLPRDGVMIEGHSEALTYTSNKKVVILPEGTDYVVDDIELSVKEFDLNYVVLSDFPFLIGAYKAIPPNMRYITDNPSRFKLINTIVEEYKPNSNRWITGNKYYVFEIQRDIR